jgi:hypothetical protein
MFDNFWHCKVSFLPSRALNVFLFCLFYRVCGGVAGGLGFGKFPPIWGSTFILSKYQTMRRDLKAIYAILLGVINREIEGEPTVFAPENIPNEEVSQSFAYYTSMLIENGFLRKVEAQADFAGMDCYRVTWKGHCFMDMFEILDSAMKQGSLTEVLIANLAVTNFH